MFKADFSIAYNIEISFIQKNLFCLLSGSLGFYTRNVLLLPLYEEIEGDLSQISLFEMYDRNRNVSTLCAFNIYNFLVKIQQVVIINFLSNKLQS